MRAKQDLTQMHLTAPIVAQSAFAMTIDELELWFGNKPATVKPVIEASEPDTTPVFEIVRPMFEIVRDSE